MWFWFPEDMIVFLGGVRKVVKTSGLRNHRQGSLLSYSCWSRWESPFMPAVTDGHRHPGCGKAMQVARTCVRVKSRAILILFVYLLTFWLLLYVVWFPAWWRSCLSFSNCCCLAGLSEYVCSFGVISAITVFALHSPALFCGQQGGRVVLSHFLCTVSCWALPGFQFPNLDS